MASKPQDCEESKEVTSEKELSIEISQAQEGQDEAVAPDATPAPEKDRAASPAASKSPKTQRKKGSSSAPPSPTLGSSSLPDTKSAGGSPVSAVSPKSLDAKPKSPSSEADKVPRPVTPKNDEETSIPGTVSEDAKDTIVGLEKLRSTGNLDPEAKGEKTKSPESKTSDPPVADKVRGDEPSDGTADVKEAVAETSDTKKIGPEKEGSATETKSERKAVDAKGKPSKRRPKPEVPRGNSGGGRSYRGYGNRSRGRRGYFTGGLESPPFRSNFPVNNAYGQQPYQGQNQHHQQQHYQQQYRPEAGEVSQGSGNSRVRQNSFGRDNSERQPGDNRQPRGNGNRDRPGYFAARTFRPAVRPQRSDSETTSTSQVNEAGAVGGDASATEEKTDYRPRSSSGNRRRRQQAGAVSYPRQTYRSESDDVSANGQGSVGYSGHSGPKPRQSGYHYSQYNESYRNPPHNQPQYDDRYGYSNSRDSYYEKPTTGYHYGDGYQRQGGQGYGYSPQQSGYNAGYGRGNGRRGNRGGSGGYRGGRYRSDTTHSQGSVSGSKSDRTFRSNNSPNVSKTHDEPGSEVN